MAKCRGCERGPIGIEGHLDLYAYRLTGQAFQFRCRVCNSLWARSRDSEGRFEWSLPTSELHVANLPGWQQPAKPA